MKFKIGQKVKLLVDLTWYGEGDIVEVTDIDNSYPDTQYEIRIEPLGRFDYAFEQFLKDVSEPPAIPKELYCKCIKPTEIPNSAEGKIFYVCTNCKKEIVK